MTLTNIYDLPEPIVQAVTNDEYSRGVSDISVTQLLSPPRQVALIREHGDELSEDVSDRIFSLFGQAIHTILERADVPGLQEERIYADFAGWTVSGQFDYIDEAGILWDWKTASTYEVQNGVKAERASQLNCYAELARRNGLTVSGIRVGFILRDWSKSKATRERNYPPHQVVVYPIELWPEQQTVAFIEERVRLHQDARSQLPECDSEERWQQKTTYAVMKDGNQRATKVYDDEEEALMDVGSRGDKFFLQERPGYNTRCESYCLASSVCTQWQALQDA